MMQAEEKFESAVEALTRFLRSCLLFNGAAIPETAPGRDVLALNLGIYWIPSCEMFPQGCYICSEDAADELLRRAWIDKELEAFELCELISAHRLATRDHLPDGLKTFSALLMSHQIERPKAARRNKTWLRAQMIYTMTQMASNEFGLRMSRNDATQPPHYTACDAVVAALLNCGIKPASYRSVKEICMGPKPENVRMREEFSRWERAIADAGQRDPISAIAIPGLLGRRPWDKDV